MLRVVANGPLCTIFQLEQDTNQAPCTRVMLNCGIDLNKLHAFIPNTMRTELWKNYEKAKLWRKCDMGTFLDHDLKFSCPDFAALDVGLVDAVLLTSPYMMLALPFLTEYSAFHGEVFATEPTIQFGRMLMEELVRYNSMSIKSDATDWNSTLKSGPMVEGAQEWRSLYTMTDIENCLSKVSIAAYCQEICIFPGVQAAAVSSGVCIGGSNWVLNTPYKKIALLSESSMLRGRHPIPIDTRLFIGADVLYCERLRQESARSCDSAIQELCSLIGVCITEGGSALIPCSPIGVMYDLIEATAAYLSSLGLQHTPLVVVSPVGDSSLAYSNVAAEWLDDAKQDHVYQPSAPFPHNDLREAGRLYLVNGVDSSFYRFLKGPCVVLCGHSSLRTGDAVQLMEIWKANPKNTILITDSDVDIAGVIAPYYPIAARVQHCPLDPRLSPEDLRTIARDTNPRIIVHSAGVARTVFVDDGGRSVVEPSNLHAAPPKGSVVVALTNEFERGLLPREVAQSLPVLAFGSSLVSPFNSVAKQRGRDGHYCLTAGEEAAPVLRGQPNVTALVASLTNVGLGVVELVPTASAAPVGTFATLSLPSIGTLIHLWPGATEVVAPTALLRKRVCGVLLSRGAIQTIGVGDATTTLGDLEALARDADEEGRAAENEERRRRFESRERRNEGGDDVDRNEFADVEF